MFSCLLVLTCCIAVKKNVFNIKQLTETWQIKFEQESHFRQEKNFRSGHIMMLSFSALTLKESQQRRLNVG